MFKRFFGFLVVFLLLAVLAASPAWALTTEWYPSGPYGGDVRDIVETPSGLFASTSYGVFRSPDGGVTWIECTPEWADPLFSNNAVYDMTWDRVGGAVYAIGKDYRVYKTIDGTSWSYTSATGLVQSADPYLCVVAGTVYANTANGLTYCDDGVNWALVESSPLFGVTKLWSDPAGNIYSYVFTTLHRKLAGSDTWVSSTMPGAVVDLAFDDSNSIYGIFSVAGTKYCYKSTDGGTTWTQMGTWPTGGTAITVSGSGSLIVVGSSTGLRVSADGGTTWNLDNSGNFHKNFSVTAVCYGSSGYYAGTPLGVYRSIDGVNVVFSSQGMKWKVNTSIATSNTGMNMVAADAVTLFARSPYGIYKSTDAGQNWAPFVETGGLLKGQGMLVSNDGYLWYAVSGDGIYKASLDGSAATKAVANTGINTLAKDVYGNLYYGAGTSLYKSTDSGATWAAFGPAVPQAPQALLVTADGTAYAGAMFNWYIYRLPAGGSWGLVRNGTYTNSIVQDVYGTLFACGPGGYAVKSADGITWDIIQVPINGSLQNVGARAVAVDSQNSVYLSVTMPSGASSIYKSVDGGASWFEFSTGIPADAVVAYLFAAPDNTIFAMTDGGIYDPPVGVDNVRPSGSLSLPPDLPTYEGLPLVTDPSVVLTVYGSDNDAVTDILVGLDPGFTGSAWQMFTGSPMTVDVAAPSVGGRKSFCVRLRDAHGNTTDLMQEAWWDVDSPSIKAFWASSSTVTAPEVVLELEVAEDLAPCEVMLSEDPAFTGADWTTCTWDYWSGRETYCTSVTFTFSAAEGAKTVYAKVRDVTGKESAASSCEVFYLKPAFTPEKISTSAWECCPTFDESGALYYVKDGDLYAFDVSTKQETRLTTGKGVWDPASVRGGIVAYRGSSGIEILMIGTGETISTGMSGTPPVTDGVYATWATSGDIYLYDVAAGSGRYLTTDGYGVLQDRPAIGGGKVFCTEGGAVVALDTGTGESSVLASPDWISGPYVAGDHVYWIGLYGATCRLERAPLDGGPVEELLTLSTEAEPCQYYLGGVSPDGRYALVWVDDPLYVVDLVSDRWYLVAAEAWDCAILLERLAWTECDWNSENLADVCYAPLSQLESAPSAPEEPESSPGHSSGSSGGSVNRNVKVDLAAGGSATLTLGGVSLTLEAADGGSGEAALEGAEGGVAVRVSGEPVGLKVVVSGGTLCTLDRHLNAWVPVSGAVYGVVGAVYHEAGRTTVFLEKDGEFMVFEKVPAVEAHVAGSRLVGRVKGVSSVLVTLNGGKHVLDARDGTFGMELRLGPGRHSLKCVAEHNGQKFLCWQKSFWRYADFDGKHWAYKAVGSFLEDNPVFGEVAFLYPDLPAKRGEVAKLLKAALNLSDPGGDVPFRDVPAEDEALASAARAVYATGLMVGYPDGTLGAGKDITRFESIVLLTRVARKLGATASVPGTAPFKDFGQVPAWARETVGEAAALGITKGYPDGTFRPLNKVSRAESAVAVLRAARRVQ
ncbi:MAG: S-layer homology domain-containing protein [Bacillota bacterium]